MKVRNVWASEATKVTVRSGNVTLTGTREELAKKLLNLDHHSNTDRWLESDAHIIRFDGTVVWKADGHVSRVWWDSDYEGDVIHADSYLTREGGYLYRPDGSQVNDTPFSSVRELYEIMERVSAAFNGSIISVNGMAWSVKAIG